jgi:hypothetical protein
MYHPNIFFPNNVIYFLKYMISGLMLTLNLFLVP